MRPGIINIWIRFHYPNAKHLWHKASNDSIFLFYDWTYIDICLDLYVWMVSFYSNIRHFNQNIIYKFVYIWEKQKQTPKKAIFIVF